MPSEEPIIASVDYQITKKDLTNALRYPTWGDPKSRRKILAWWVGTLLGAVLLSVAAYRVLGQSVVPFLGAPFAIALQWPFLLRSHAANLAKIYAKQPGALEPARMMVRPDALLVVSQRAETRVDWHAVRDIETTGEYTFFILGRFQVLALPWRAFDTPSAAQRFTQLARHQWLSASTRPANPQVIPNDIDQVLGSERVVVHFDQTLSDIRALVVGQLLRKRWFLPGLALTSLLFGLFIRFTDGPINGVLTGIGFFLLVIALIFGTVLGNAKQSKGVLGSHTLVASPVGYWTQAPGVASSVQRWSTLTDIAASDRHLLLYRGPDFVIGIPKRGFASSDEVDQFLAQITRWRLAQLAAGDADLPA